MSDPLSALSLAATILQFVDFGSKLVSKGWQVYRNGASVRTIEVEAAVDRLQKFASTLKLQLRPPEGVKRSGTGTEESQILSDLAVSEHALDGIAEKCSRVAGNLASHLQTLKLQGSVRGRVWKSFRQALKETLGKSGVKNTLKQLEEYKEDIKLHILASLKMSMNLQTLESDKRFSELDLKIQVLIQGMLDGQDALELALQRCTQDIIKSQEQGKQEILKAVSMATAAHEHLLTVNRRSVQEKVLELLHFRWIDDRYDEIEAAHKETFEWVFRGSKLPDAQWDDLKSFLESGRGCYWISGKAGSGKSTLMKFICNHRETKSALSTWAAESSRKLLMPNFFFWSVGTTLQKTQKGLFRSLLYKILTEYPDLIKLVLPSLFEQAAKPVSADRDLSEPSLGELRRAVKALFSQRSQALRICFFIDGVDEYGGDIDALAEVLTEVSSNEGVKIVLSSRPTSDCFHAFQHYPKLRLQDLTAGDIKRFVNDKLWNHTKMKALAREKPTEAKALADSIVAKADGVFLWVRLVTMSLSRGLRNEDDIRTLQLRADECPDDLLTLYQHMFGKLEKHYREKAAEIFQILRANRSNVLEAMTLWFADRGDLTHALASDPVPMSDETFTQRCETIDHQLRSICCGLLEVRSYRGRRRRPPEIHYLHKSVAEFVYSTDIWKAIVRSSERKNFNPEESLARASLLHLREICGFKTDRQLQAATDSTRGEEVLRWVGMLVQHLQNFEIQTKKPLSRLVAAFTATVQYAVKQNRWSFKDADRLPTKPLFRGARSQPFEWELSIAVQTGLSIAARRLLDQKREHSPGTSFDGNMLSLALHHTVQAERGAWQSPLYHRLILVEALLRHGADPDATDTRDAANRSLSVFSAWERLLRMHRHPRVLPGGHASDFDLLAWANIIKQFLIHGAHPSRPVPWLENILETPLYIVAQSLFSGLVGDLWMEEETTTDDDWIVVGVSASASAEERSPFTAMFGTRMLEILSVRDLKWTPLEKLGRELIALITKCAKKAAS